jgi:aminoglycoside 3-N-acetyltransferase
VVAALRDAIASALVAVGLKRGDLTLVHSDASPVIKMLADDDWSHALELLTSVFRDVLGPEGTLVVPTFNWDFCKGHPFDALTSPSQLGLFSNYVRTRPDAARSRHPIFSFAGIGPEARPLFDGITKSSFGRGSVFDRLMRRDARLVFFNTSFFFCTFVHYIEQMRGVSYRYLKHFTGTLTVDGVTYEDTVDFYVRDEKQVVDSYPTRLGERLRSKGLLFAARFGASDVLSATCHDVYEEAFAALDEDPYFLLKHPPVPVGSAS